jgi:hypothetical protein
MSTLYYLYTYISSQLRRQISQLKLSPYYLHSYLGTRPKLFCSATLQFRVVSMYSTSCFQLQITVLSMTGLYLHTVKLYCLLLLLLFLLLLLYSPLLDLGRFFSFLILYTVDRTPWTGISPSQGFYLHTEQHNHRTNAHNTDIHALSGIRTHDSSVRASEDSSCLRWHGHCDRQNRTDNRWKYGNTVRRQSSSHVGCMLMDPPIVVSKLSTLVVFMKSVYLE